MLEYCTLTMFVIIIKWIEMHTYTQKCTPTLRNAHLHSANCILLYSFQGIRILINRLDQKNS